MYIVSGFCFVKVYGLVYVRELQDDIDNMLTLSLVIGFIICNIAYLIPFSCGEILDNIGITVFSIILGFLSGKLMNSTKISHFILSKLQIRRTANSYIWNDIMDNNFVMEAEIVIGNTTYSGKVHLIEECNNSPHIVLAEYSIDGKKQNAAGKIVVLDTSMASSVTVKYNENSKMREFIKFED